MPADTQDEKSPIERAEFSPRHFLVLSARQRGEALSEITSYARRISRVGGLPKADKLLDGLNEREQRVTTRIDERVAMPHAKFPQLERPVVVIGISLEGVDWDGHNQGVQLVVCVFTSGPDEHIDLLSYLARRLQDSTVIERLQKSVSNEQRFALLSAEPARPRSGAQLDPISDLTLAHASRLLHQIPEAQVVVNGSTPDDAADRYDLAIRREPVFLDRPPHAGRRLPRDASHLMLTLVAEGLVRADDTVVYIYDSTRDGNIDSVRVMRVAAILALPSGFTQSELGSVARLDVLLRVFQLASELSSEGREGKPVGTIFVVGDDERLENLTQQLILNPFAGHADEDRNLLDPSIGETVKELAKLDGAFLISADGTVRAAGTHLSGRPIRDQMSSGLGARHAAALGISAAAKVIALCISESTRRVSVYWAGRRLTED